MAVRKSSDLFDGIRAGLELGQPFVRVAQYKAAKADRQEERDAENERADAIRQEMQDRQDQLREEDRQKQVDDRNSTQDFQTRMLQTQFQNKQEQQQAQNMEARERLLVELAARDRAQKAAQDFQAQQQAQQQDRNDHPLATRANDIAQLHAGYLDKLDDLNDQMNQAQDPATQRRLQNQINGWKKAYETLSPAAAAPMDEVTQVEEFDPDGIKIGSKKTTKRKVLSGGKTDDEIQADAIRKTLFGNLPVPGQDFPVKSPDDAAPAPAGDVSTFFDSWGIQGGLKKPTQPRPYAGAPQG